MSDISNQLIKDSYNYVLQSDLSSGTVYRIGGTIPVNPKFLSGLTVMESFVYSDGTEQPNYALLTDGTGLAFWGPISAATPSSGVTSVTAGFGLSGDVTTGAVTLINTSPDQTVTISGGTGITTGGTYPNFTIVNSAPDRTVTLTGGTNIQITGTYPDFGVNYTGTTIVQGITGITGTSGVSASTTDYVTTIINTSPDQTVTLTGGTNIQITGTYPDFGVNFTGSTTGGTVSGDYLPLSGGTVTGGTIFQSGLTANTIYSSGQVGVGTSNPNAAAIIEIASTSQGVLFPRMTKVQRDSITSPPVGLILFVTDGDNEGLYIYKTSGWVQII